VCGSVLLAACTECFGGLPAMVTTLHLISVGASRSPPAQHRASSAPASSAPAQPPTFMSYLMMSAKALAPSAPIGL
jgi:hypothetical protein